MRQSLEADKFEWSFALDLFEEVPVDLIIKDHGHIAQLIHSHL